MKKPDIKGKEVAVFKPDKRKNIRQYKTKLSNIKNC